MLGMHCTVVGVSLFSKVWLFNVVPINLVENVDTIDENEVIDDEIHRQKMSALTIAETAKDTVSTVNTIE